jgi:hypoxanthine phosphoribosyltransferase
VTVPAPAFRVLLAHAEIRRRIGELARQIELDLPVPDVILVAIIEGARTFARHLQAALGAAPVVHEIRASSYGRGTTSSGHVQIVGVPDVLLAGRTLLLVEDIVDTGRTVAALRGHFLAHGVADCRVATLLTKPARREIEVPLHYVGFAIPDEFVIGFGMDVAGRYRELPDVVVYDPEIERAAVAGATRVPHA